MHLMASIHGQSQIWRFNEEFFCKVNFYQSQKKLFLDFILWPIRFLILFDYFCKAKNKTRWPIL